MLQNLCKQGLGWDSEISAAETQDWELWLNSLPGLSNLRIRRCIKPEAFGDVVECEIHHFADASFVAYGSCCYIRLTDDKGNIHCSFLIGKSRLSPIETVSIPRLELTAAVLSVKLDKLVRKELDVINCPSTFWLDSTAVLFSIKNSTKRFPVFVANRLAIIEKHCNGSQWRHVPTKLNPADVASRGASVNSIVFHNPWLSGPEFLWHSETHWPSDPIINEQTSLESLPSDFIPKKREAIVNVTAASKPISCTVIDRLTERYSSLPKLLKFTAWIIRYIQFCRARKSSTLLSSYLSADELQYAELALIKYVQLQHFFSLV